MDPHSSTLRPGDKLDHYAIRRRIGAGGMGIVFVAEDERLNRLVALKVINRAALGDSDAAERFLLEAKTLAKLQHPNVVNIFGIGEVQGSIYIAMEYVDGSSLDELIKQGRISLLDAISIIRQVAEGLSCAHKLGIIHRDIKPMNILVENTGHRAKLIDFGIAKSVDQSTDGLTEEGSVIGTLNYLAPELFNGTPASIQSDLYALGLVIHETITGSKAFVGPSPAATINHIQQGGLDYPLQLNGLVPNAVKRLIERLTHRNPQIRPVSADALLQELIKLEKNIPNLAPILGRSLLHLDKEKAIEVANVFKSLDCPNYYIPLFHLTAATGQSVESFIKKMQSLQQITLPLDGKAQDHDPTLRLATVGPIKPTAPTPRQSLINALSAPKPNAPILQPIPTRPAPSRTIGLFGVLAIAIAGSFGLKKVIAPDRLPAATNPPIASVEVPQSQTKTPADKSKTLSLTYVKNVNTSLLPGQIEEPPNSAPKWGNISARPDAVGTVYMSRTVAYARSDLSEFNISYQRETIVEVLNDQHRSVIEHINDKGAKLGLPDTQTKFTTGNSLFRSQYVDSPEWGSVELTSNGSFSMLFPLQIGRAIRFDSNVKYSKFNGEYSLKKYCKVIGQELVELQSGKFNTVRIDCYEIDSELPADQFYYAPSIGSFVKNKRFRKGFKENDGPSMTVWELLSKVNPPGTERTEVPK